MVMIAVHPCSANSVCIQNRFLNNINRHKDNLLSFLVIFPTDKFIQIWHPESGMVVAQIWLLSASGIAWRHESISWTNFDLSSRVFCDIRLRGISQGVFVNWTCDMCSKITTTSHKADAFILDGPRYFTRSRRPSWQKGVWSVKYNRKLWLVKKPHTLYRNRACWWSGTYTNTFFFMGRHSCTKRMDP